jgi:hypothetical protein
VFGIQFANVFNQALPEAAFWGRVALSVGSIGLFVSLILVALHLRDNASLSRGQEDPNNYRPPRFGRLSGSLGEFFADPTSNAPLSPDAAAEFVVGRLDAQREATQSVIRYFSYAPLLFGLMGTILSLRALLVDSGDTLQQIQPQLAGVFAGTLAGIAGSLISAVGGLILDTVSLSSLNCAQDFAHRYILPTLPERRIALRIEDAVLAVITERTKTVADNFNSSLQPVVSHLQQVAQQSGDAAVAATNAFSQAARAVKEAGDLELAARSFKSGAHMIDSSAKQLSDATKQTAEIILRLAEIRCAYTGLTDCIHQSATALNLASQQMSEVVTTHISTIRSRSEDLNVTIAGFRSGVDSLTVELQKQGSVYPHVAELIRSQADATSKSLDNLIALSQQTNQLLGAMPKHTELLAGAISSSVENRVESATNKIVDSIGLIGQPLNAFIDRTTGESHGPTTTESPSQADNAEALNLLELNKSLRDASSQLRILVDQCRMLVESINRIQSAPEPKKSDGFFRRIFGG